MSLNLITDVAGLSVGAAHDAAIASGVTAILFDEPAVAAVDVRGGAPGTRETELLAPERTVERIDAVVLSGGSAFGLEAAAGVMAYLAEAGRGFKIGSTRVPIVPSAILFDIARSGPAVWGRYPPYRELGFCAAEGATGAMRLGSVGAGTGAETATLKGGLGSASTRIGPFTVGAIVAVNALGSAIIGDGPHFWAAPFELGREFGGLGVPDCFSEAALEPRIKRASPGSHTTIGLVATDARLTSLQARHLAVMAQDGLARALHPVHTPLDGDAIFSAATGRVALSDQLLDMIALGTAAAQVLARACARGVYEATAPAGDDWKPAWRDRFASGA